MNEYKELYAMISDQNRRDNILKAKSELVELFNDIDYGVHDISEEKTEMEGYTRLRFSKIGETIDIIRSRYGYYCDISFCYDPCSMILKIKVEERENRWI